MGLTYSSFSPQSWDYRKVGVVYAIRGHGIDGVGMCVNVVVRVCVCSFRQLQVSSDSELSELNNQVKLKSFEAERTQLVHDETCRVLRQTQLDNEKINSKLEVCCIHEQLHEFISTYFQ